MPLLINKPTGYTSHDIVAIVRKKLNVKKVGHAGTLDPLASGLLIILVGREETKRQAEFMAGNKEYIADITLGQRSVTDDAEGPITPGQNPQHLTEQHIVAVLQNFVGEIQQVPPIYSAIKQRGQPLYKIARQGRNVPVIVEPRPVTIHAIDLLEINLPVIKIKVRCSKGTYIRSLARDIGEALGVGAYMSDLTRTRSGEFSLADAVTLEQFKAQD